MAPAQRSCREETHKRTEVTYPYLPLCPPATVTRACALCKGRKIQAAPNWSSQLWERQHDIANLSHRRAQVLQQDPTRESSTEEKGGQRNGLHGVHRLSKHRSAPGFASSLRLSDGKGRAQESRRRRFATWPQAQRWAYVTFVAPGLPWALWSNHPRCCRRFGQLQASNAGGGNTSCEPGKRQRRSPQSQCWGWNPRPAHWKDHPGSRQIEIQGSTASTDPVFISCWASCIDIVVLRMGWQICRRNKWNYKPTQTVRTLTCQEGYLPHRHLLQGFHA